MFPPSEDKPHWDIRAMVTCAEVHTKHQDVATSKKGAVIKINFMSVRENRAKLTTIKGEAGLRTASCGEETAAMMIAALQSNQPPASHVMSIARFERFFRIVASLDVDKQDLKRYSDFIDQKLYDLLLRAQAVAKANGRVMLEPFDLPITKGLQECIHEFERLDEEIELRPILDRLATRPPLDLAYGEDVEARLPEIVGGLSVALARTFNIIDSGLKNPSDVHWRKCFRIFNLLL